MREAKGSCLCGAVRFGFDFPSLWCAHCYCTLCRKAHGAGFVTWIGVAESQFTVSAGTAHIASYASSPGATREFCDRCGSSLFFRSEKWPGEVHIALGCLDTPVDRVPDKNVFTSDKAAWIALLDLDRHKA